MSTRNGEHASRRSPHMRMRTLAKRVIEACLVRGHGIMIFLSRLNGHRPAAHCCSCFLRRRRWPLRRRPRAQCHHLEVDSLSKHLLRRMPSADDVADAKSAREEAYHASRPPSQMSAMITAEVAIDASLRSPLPQPPTGRWQRVDRRRHH